jgi:hypothetical protein
MCSPAFAQYSQRQATVFQSTGKPANQATVTVCASTDVTCATPITIYSSSVGAAKANPFSTDTVGNYSFFQQTGYYTVKETYLGASYTYKILLADTVHCVSPVEFGAVIDGTTNDTVAIQAAHDYAVSNGFKNVCFPEGTYKVTSGLTWSPYIHALSLGRVIFTTALASGSFLKISDQYGKPSPSPDLTGTTRTKGFTGTFVIENTNAANTANTFLIGGATNAYFASEDAVVDGMVVEGFNGTVFQLGYGAFNLHIANFAGIFNKGFYFSILPGATGSGENISVDHSVFGENSVATDTAYLLSINSGLEIDFNFQGCSFDYLLGINDPAQAAQLTQVHFVNSHFEWNETSAPFIDAENGIQINIVNAKFVSPTVAGFASPAVGKVAGASVLTVQNGRYEFGGTVAKAFDLTGTTGTMALDAVVNTSNAITVYYTYNTAAHMVLMGRDLASDIDVGDNLATTNFVGKNFTTAHSAANVPSEMDYGVVDGGLMNGMKVKNVRDGSFNSQSIELAVQHGGVSSSTALTVDKDANIKIPKGIRTGTASQTDLAGICTLGTSCVITFTQTYTSAPICVATDTTAAAAVKAVVTTTSATFTGTGTDVLNYVCIGRN